METVMQVVIGVATVAAVAAGVYVIVQRRRTGVAQVEWFEGEGFEVEMRKPRLRAKGRAHGMPALVEHKMHRGSGDSWYHDTLIRVDAPGSLPETIAQRRAYASGERSDLAGLRVTTLDGGIYDGFDIGVRDEAGLDLWRALADDPSIAALFTNDAHRGGRLWELSVFASQISILVHGQKGLGPAVFTTSFDAAQAIARRGAPRA